MKVTIIVDLGDLEPRVRSLIDAMDRWAGVTPTEKKDETVNVEGLADKLVDDLISNLFRKRENGTS